MENKPTIVPQEIRNLIYTIRGRQVMLDSDLATLYHVETKILNKAVKRNIERFPEKFCFQLTDEEADFLRFQIGTSNQSCASKSMPRISVICARILSISAFRLARFS